MELRAVIEGLRTLNSGWVAGERNIQIVTDSEYVAGGLMSWMQNWSRNGWRKKKHGDTVKNADLWKDLHLLTKVHSISVQVVPGHSGHPENEECDVMAADAALASHHNA